jgi:hypothetical protein
MADGVGLHGSRGHGGRWSGNRAGYIYEVMTGVSKLGILN